MASNRERVMQAAADPAWRSLVYRLDPPPDGVGTLDCSLYVRKAFDRAGLPFPTSARTAEQLRQVCAPIGWEAVQPGDLLFFQNTYPCVGASHVGISEGTGTRQMWDCHERSDGSPAVGRTFIGSAYWVDHLWEARRPPHLATAEGRPTTPDADLQRCEAALQVEREWGTALLAQIGGWADTLAAAWAARDEEAHRAVLDTMRRHARGEG
jgi:hypothetical protein